VKNPFLIGAKVYLRPLEKEENRHTSFGIVVGDKTEWGKGYGSEATQLMVGHAFETLNLNRVWLRVFEYNARGIRAYEKVGFKKEGVLRQDRFQDGRYWDTFAMAILRDEYSSLTFQPANSQKRDL
jgi:RimJ/RimL family protein N-acetyltransferase